MDKLKRTPKLYLKLFLSTLQLSAFTFGGGYVIVSLLQKKFVENFKWINKNEMLDIVAISQSSPGAIAINASILIGYRIGGVLGALCTVIGTIIPPLFIISIISFFYVAFKENMYVAAALKGMQAGIGAIIVDVIYKMSKNYIKEKDYLSLVLMVVAFSLAYFLEINVIFIIIGGVIFGILLYIYNRFLAKPKDKVNDDNTKNCEDEKTKENDKKSLENKDGYEGKDHDKLEEKQGGDNDVT